LCISRRTTFKAGPPNDELSVRRHEAIPERKRRRFGDELAAIEPAVLDGAPVDLDRVVFNHRSLITGGSGREKIPGLWPKLTFAGVAMVLAVVALAAICVPARRARIPPMAALRTEQ
jgi:hypothetical protein